MPRPKPDQFDFGELIRESPEDIAGGFVWMLNDHILQGNIALMGFSGSGFSVWCYFRALYSNERSWVKMPSWTQIAEKTDINRNTVKKICQSLEEKNFLEFQTEGNDKRKKYVGFKVVDNTFMKSGNIEAPIMAITHPFEPENAKKTVDGYTYFKKTGDISRIPNASLDKNPPINLHITINNTVNNTVIKQEAGDNGQNISISINEGNKESMNELQEKWGMSLLEMVQEYQNTGTLPKQLIEVGTETSEED
jgi:predicted regulator of amino acid metabolism with ACT domain